MGSSGQLAVRPFVATGIPADASGHPLPVSGAAEPWRGDPVLGNPELAPNYGTFCHTIMSGSVRKYGFVAQRIVVCLSRRILRKAALQGIVEPPRFIG